jgi:AcrR family transcriptional regulator
MRADNPSTAETKQRLLDAAGETFAKLGFHKATVREICERAKANVAAVNYHFGDKEGLYSAVLKYAHACSLEKYPPLLGLSDDAPSGKRLRAFIHAFLLRIFDEGRPAWHGKLMAREIVEPTRALEVFVEQSIRPQFARLSSIIRDIVGDGANEEQIRLCGSSVIGQCLFYHHARAVIDRLHPEQRYGARDIERLADHIARFSLAALSRWSRVGEGIRDR